MTTSSTPAGGKLPARKALPVIGKGSTFPQKGPEAAKAKKAPSPPLARTGSVPAGQFPGVRSGFQKVNRSRIVVTEMVYHQPPDEQPTVTQTKFIRWLEGGEQAYVRKTEVSDKWVKVDLGWLTAVGMLVLRNDEPRIQSVPTQEQRYDQEAKTLEIGVLAEGGKESSLFPIGVVRPSESARVEPAEAVTYYVRCREGSAKITIAADPK